MLYYLVKIVSSLVCNMPLTLRRNLGLMLGGLCWPLVPAKRKNMCIDNISRAFNIPRGEAVKIAKASGVRFGPMFMEVLHMPRLNKDNISQYVTIAGGEQLQAALALGRGAVLATAHTGNWELLGAALAMHGFPLVAVVQRQTNEAMNRFINEYRTQAGMHVTYKQGVREMVKLMGEGNIIGLLMDQDNYRHGVFVEFFGRLASTPQGAAALARINDAPIIPAFITENPDGSHKAIIHPPVFVEKTADRTEDIRRTTQILTGIVEAHIRQHPEEWFWLHNRWKTAPPGTK